MKRAFDIFVLDLQTSRNLRPSSSRNPSNFRHEGTVRTFFYERIKNRPAKRRKRRGESPLVEFLIVADVESPINGRSESPYLNSANVLGSSLSKTDFPRHNC